MKINFPKLFRRLLRVVFTLLLLYALSLVFVYFKQERFFFNPKHLEKDYVFKFTERFEELDIPVAEDIKLNALLFKTQQTRKGVIVYYHGNAGAIHEWGKRAPLYLDNGYDILFFDYRNYGKSDGEYCNTEQLLNDSETVYNFVKQRYPENQIIILGYSLGSGLATYVASRNRPKMLILNAPYYSWKTLITEEIAPPIPEYLIKYDIPTYQYLKTVSCPINIFYGTRDFLIHPETNAKKLQALKPNGINLHPITDGGHNGLHITKQYYDELKKIL
ncbi:alpha/beta hydrolase [Hanstruepera flava]|uniref:alpha/beta hydrolase n=1 Tax=Hanstruepera flava TaxID=2930218 RepID=UPI0020286E41|nr:alpha/beta fold hydrolase [Hanstruepera flava]